MIYLLHSTVPLGGTGRNSARHYLGWCLDHNLKARVQAHREGKAHCAITTAYLKAGAQLLLVACLPGGTREDERLLKAAAHHSRLCPICSPDLVVIGYPPGLVALIPRRKRYPKRSERRLTANGGAWLPPSPTASTTPSGPSLPGPLPASGTGSGGAGPGQATGGTSSTVAAPPSPQGATSSAGTRQPSTSGSGTPQGGSYGEA